MQNNRFIRPINECFWVKGEDFSCANRPQRRTITACFTVWTSSSFDEAMDDVNEKITLDSHRKLRTALNFEVSPTLI